MHLTPLVKHLLVRTLRSLLSEKLSKEGDRWRDAVAQDMALLRRTGPFQLALLSSLRRDDDLLPVIEIVWQHSLHTSCPKSDANDHPVLQHWVQVAYWLLSNPGPVQTSAAKLLAVQQRNLDDIELCMPGAPAIMHVVLPEAMSQDFQDASCPCRSQEITGIIQRIALRMSAMMQNYLPYFKDILQDQGMLMINDCSDLGLLGADVIKEIAARACASLGNWPGLAVYKQVRSYLSALTSLVHSRLVQERMNEAPLGEHCFALLPAACAAILLPMAEYVARVEAHLGTTTESNITTEKEWADYIHSSFDVHPSSSWLEMHAAARTAALLCQRARVCQNVMRDVEPRIEGTNTDSLLQMMELKVLVEDHQLTSESCHCGLISFAIASHILTSSESGVCNPEAASIVMQRMYGIGEAHEILELMFEFMQGRDEQIPLDMTLSGVHHALCLLPTDYLRTSRALQAGMNILQQGIHLAGNTIQRVQKHRTPLLQVSMFISQQLMTEVVPSRNGRIKDSCCFNVLDELRCLMRACASGAWQEGDLKHTALSSLQEALPKSQASCLWDGPLVAFMTDALVSTSSLGLVIHSLGERAVAKEKKAACDALQRLFSDVCNILKQKDDRKFSPVLRFLGLMIARELTTQSVTMVENLRPDDAAELSPELAEIRETLLSSICRSPVYG